MKTTITLVIFVVITVYFDVKSSPSNLANKLFNTLSTDITTNAYAYTSADIEREQ